MILQYDKALDGTLWRCELDYFLSGNANVVGNLSGRTIKISKYMYMHVCAVRCGNFSQA